MEGFDMVEQSGRTVWSIWVLAGLGISLTILGYTIEVDQSTWETVLSTCRSLGPFGIVCIGIGYCLIATLPVPLMPMTAVVGYALGFWTGFWCLWPAAIISSVLSHWIGARFLENRLDVILKRFPKARVLCEAAAQTGWKSVAANRLLPVCPFAIQNMLLGAVGVRKRDQAVGTALGIIPASTFALYCGSVAQELTTAFTQPEQALPMGRVLLLSIAGLVLFAVLVWGRLVLKRSLENSGG